MDLRMHKSLEGYQLKMRVPVLARKEARQRTIFADVVPYGLLQGISGINLSKS